MTSYNSEGNRKTCVDIVKEGKDKVIRSVRILHKSTIKNSLDRWIGNPDFGEVTMSRDYEMPRNIDWKLLDRLYNVTPKNYEELISIKGVGPSMVRSLALIAELIYGNKASWEDPVKYSFTQGGKDGFPYPVDREVYDNSIHTLKDALDQSRLDKKQKMSAVRRL